MAMNFTPLRYPGGKSKLFPFLKEVFRLNKLYDADYVEPYAGGAGVALEMLMTEHASSIHLNDLNLPLYAFWHSVLYETEALCKKIERCTLSVPAWKRHKNIVRSAESHEFLELGFSFFFLNRTNRSGIINGGVIGGLDQTGNYKIDARFNRKDLIRRIRKIAEYRERIHLYNKDACEFLLQDVPSMPKKTFVYLDPPYFNKGQRLYDNSYSKSDHAHVSEIVKQIDRYWIVSYDNVPDICDLYSEYRQSTYDLHYSAATSRTGSELMIFCDDLSFVDCREYVAA